MPETDNRFSFILKNAGCSRPVISHCSAVAECALAYAKKNPLADRALVETGAWLHDIGRARTHSIDHAQAGAEMIRSMGMDEDIARIVECHTGAGLTADECTLLGLLPVDCMPMTTEEKIVTHADNRISGSTRVTIDESIASAIHLPKKARRKMYRLANEVELLCGP